MAECKVGIVGVGKMGEYHVGVLSDMREAELVGIVDSDQKRAKIVTERYKTLNYKDYKELFKKLMRLLLLFRLLCISRLVKNS